MYVVAAAADDDGDGYGYDDDDDDDDDDPIELFQTRGKWWELIVLLLNHVHGRGREGWNAGPYIYILQVDKCL